MKATAPVRSNVRLLVQGRLRRFLAPERRSSGIVDVALHGTHAVKDPIESVGVPHVEIASVDVDGIASPLSRRVHGGETVVVHPVERQSAGMPPRFVLDAHLGRLARYLRLAGIDSSYDPAATDEALRDHARAGRVLLTRDVALLKRGDVRNAAFVHATAPDRQVAEVCERFDLTPTFQPFMRCARCNGCVVRVDAQTVAAGLPERIRREVDRFSRCSGCGQVYWRGSHEDRLRERFARVGVHLP